MYLGDLGSISLIRQHSHRNAWTACKHMELIQSGWSPGCMQWTKQTNTVRRASAKKSHETYNIAIPAQGIPKPTCINSLCNSATKGIHPWAWKVRSCNQSKWCSSPGFFSGFAGFGAWLRIRVQCWDQIENLTLLIIGGAEPKTPAIDNFSNKLGNTGNKIKAQMPSTTPCTIVSALNKGIAQYYIHDTFIIDHNLYAIRNIVSSSWSSSQHVSTSTAPLIALHDHLLYIIRLTPTSGRGGI